MNKDDEMLDAITQHFQNIDKMNEVLEEIVLMMKEFDARLRAVEIMIPKKDDDNEKGEAVLA